MARRKKEEAIVHQKRIAEAAIKLFKTKGIDKTKMDEIAALAGYGKATLYVYFKNKQDIITFLSYYSLKKLRDSILDAINGDNNQEEVFLGVCKSIENYEKDYPEIFRMSLGNISEKLDEDSEWAKKTYDVGEEINKLIINYLDCGVSQGIFTKIDNYHEEIFRIWGMIAGVIIIANSKEDYLKGEICFEKDIFLENSYKKIYETLLCPT